LGAGSTCGSSVWNAGYLDPVTGKINADWPGASGLPAVQFQINASSPGDWSNKTQVEIRYWLNGSNGGPEIQIETSPANETVELLTGIDPANFVCEVNERSAYIRVFASPLPAGLTAPQLSAPLGPRYFEWPAVILAGGTTVAPIAQDYLNAVVCLGDQIEVALVASPDLYHPDFPDPVQQVGVITAMLNQANVLHDRLVMIDVPPTNADPLCAVKWVQQNLRQTLTEDVLRNGAVYHPYLLVADPLGTVANPLNTIPPSGSVAGVISRLDLQLGAYFTPANAPLEQTFDLATLLTADDQANIYNGGINLLTCSPNQGLLVWGGRVLGQSSPGGFVAHRRLIHLLVRAIRRVAEPLVFDTNGPQLWLAFVRSITTVLLEAYRAGALQGDSPSQAFQVTCDATTNPPDQIASGMVVCLINIAPAIPMEFITLRVAVSAQGQLEVFES